jgi:ribosome-associated translation inhibitor RaiA
MKLTLQHIALRSTHTFDSWIEDQILALRPRLQIDEATVRLVRQRAASPAYRVEVHLVTPGPDVLVEGDDHTLRAAVVKAMQRLGEQIAARARKRVQRVKSNLSRPAAKARGARTH